MLQASFGDATIFCQDQDVIQDVIYVYIYIYTHMYVHTDLHTYIYTYIQYIHIYIYVYIYIYIYIHVWSCMYMYLWLCLKTRLLYPPTLQFDRENHDLLKSEVSYFHTNSQLSELPHVVNHQDTKRLCFCQDLLSMIILVLFGGNININIYYIIYIYIFIYICDFMIFPLISSNLAPCSCPSWPA